MKNLVVFILVIIALTANMVSASTPKVQKIVEFNAGFKSMAYFSGNIYVLTRENCIIKVSLTDQTTRKIRFANPTDSSFTDLAVVNDKAYLCHYSSSQIYILDLQNPEKGLSQISCRSDQIGRINAVSVSKSALVIKDDKNNLYTLNSSGQTRKISENAQFINDGFPILATCRISSNNWQVTFDKQQYAYSGKDARDIVVQLMPVGSLSTGDLIFLEVTGEGTFDSRFYLTRANEGSFERICEIDPPALFGINIAVTGDSDEVYLARRNPQTDMIQIERIENVVKTF